MSGGALLAGPEEPARVETVEGVFRISVCISSPGVSHSLYLPFMTSTNDFFHN